jgi:hypothetical protein
VTGVVEGRARGFRSWWYLLLVAGLTAVVVAGLLVGAVAAAAGLVVLLLLAALARLVLPAGAAGPLVVRSRFLDVVVCLVLAVLIVVALQIVPTRP